jgi:hypothetical protein
VLGGMEGIFTVGRVRRSCVGMRGDLTTMVRLVVSLDVSRVRELFFKQAQGRLVQPESWRCAGGSL